MYLLKYKKDQSMNYVHLNVTISGSTLHKQHIQLYKEFSTIFFNKRLYFPPTSDSIRSQIVWPYSSL
jgi:hypothetical protein